MTGDECLDVLTNPASDERAVKLAWEAYCMARYHFIPAAPDHWTDTKLLNELLKREEAKRKRLEATLALLITEDRLTRHEVWTPVTDCPKQTERLECAMLRFEVYTGFEPFEMRDGTSCTWLATCWQVRYEGPDADVVLADDTIWSAGAGSKELAKERCREYAERLRAELRALTLNKVEHTKE